MGDEITANDDGVKSVQFILDKFKKILNVNQDIQSESIAKDE